MSFLPEFLVLSAGGFVAGLTVAALALDVDLESGLARDRLKSRSSMQTLLSRYIYIDISIDLSYSNDFQTRTF